MRSDNFGFLVICWSLYRTKFVYIIASRHNYHSCRMLSCCPLYSCTACRQTKLLGPVKRISLYFLVFLYESQCSFIRYRTYCSCFEHILFSEKLLRISVRFRLILACKVQVYIRCFISLEAQKCFKRYIMSVTKIICTAIRTFFRR